MALQETPIDNSTGKKNSLATVLFKTLVDDCTILSKNMYRITVFYCKVTFVNPEPTYCSLLFLDSLFIITVGKIL